MNHLSIADLKQIAVVSHLFHEEALREILLRGVRFTRTVTKLHAFCIFMCDRRRRDPPLFSFLRTLHINITSFTMGEYFHPDPLFTVLSRASSLDDLEIYWTNRMFSPTYDERLAAIIPKLRHLRRLRLFTPELYTHVRKLVAQIVRTLRSQLDILEIGCWPTPSYVYEDFPPNLGVYQTNLRVLGISYPDLVNTPWIPLPTVLTLKLLLPTDFPTSLRHIAQVFPPLRELAISYSQTLGPLPAWDTIDPSQAHARNEALAFQR